MEEFDVEALLEASLKRPDIKINQSDGSSDSAKNSIPIPSTNSASGAEKQDSSDHKKRQIARDMHFSLFSS